MLETAFVAAAVLVTVTSALAWSTRARHYRRLGRFQAEAAVRSGDFAVVGPANIGLPLFEQRLAVLEKPLREGDFRAIAAEVDQLSRTERSFVPTHKKGGTVAYETLCETAPRIVALYQSAALRNLISGIVGARVVPTPLHDQSSCSLLFYERSGDHIGWHYDHNFYRGRHFTVLLPIVNRNADGTGLSAARLHARIDGEDCEIPTPPNTLVVFEGAHVLHRATPIAEGERRIVLSMTFATDPASSIAQGIARRVKDTAFFGIRALWT